MTAGPIVLPETATVEEAALVMREADVMSLGDLECRRDPASALADISSARANT